MSSPDIVFIEGLKVEASIGVYDWEKQIKQSLVFDLELATDLRDAGKSDDVHDTVCYATVSDCVTRVTTSKHFDLLEALGQALTTQLLTDFPIQSLMLRIAKPGAVPTASNVGIKIYRDKNSVLQPHKETNV